MVPFLIRHFLNSLFPWLITTINRFILSYYLFFFFFFFSPESYKHIRTGSTLFSVFFFFLNVLSFFHLSTNLKSSSCTYCLLPHLHTSAYLFFFYVDFHPRPHHITPPTTTTTPHLIQFNCKYKNTIFFFCEIILFPFFFIIIQTVIFEFASYIVKLITR